MDCGMLSLAHAFPGRVNINDIGTSKTGNGGTMHMPGDLTNCYKVSRRSSRKTSFDDIHIETGKLLSHLEFLFSGHSCPRGLLSIAQGCVKNPNNRRICHYCNSLSLAGNDALV